MFNYLIQGIVIPASIALGMVGFLRDLFPGLGFPDTAIAIVLLALATGIGLTKVEFGAWATGAMVIVECIVLGIVTVAAFAHPHQNLAEVTFHPTVLNNGELVAVGFAVMLATLAPAFNVINGYDAALGFSEELKGGERNIAKAVIISAVLACVLIMVPLIAAVVAAPDLKEFFSDPAPVVYSVQASLGDKARVIVDVGVSIALFNAMLSLLMYFGRGVYTTGRDGMWPASVNRVVGSINRFRVPGVGILCLAVPAAVLVFTSALNFLIIFAGTVIAAVYFCIGLAAFWSRRSMPDEPRPFKLPLWPLPPLVVIGFTGIALATQETQYLVAEVILIVLALAAWAGSKKWSPRVRRHRLRSTRRHELRTRLTRLPGHDVGGDLGGRGSGYAHRHPDRRHRTTRSASTGVHRLGVAATSALRGGPRTRHRRRSVPAVRVPQQTG